MPVMMESPIQINALVTIPFCDLDKSLGIGVAAAGKKALRVFLRIEIDANQLRSRHS